MPLPIEMLERRPYRRLLLAAMEEQEYELASVAVWIALFFVTDNWPSVFGEVIEGMDVVDKFAAVATTTKGAHQNVPRTPVLIVRAREAKPAPAPVAKPKEAPPAPPTP